MGRHPGMCRGTGRVLIKRLLLGCVCDPRGHLRGCPSALGAPMAVIIMMADVMDVFILRTISSSSCCVVWLLLHRSAARLLKLYRLLVFYI